MYTKHDSEARSRNHCCRGKTTCVCMCAVLVIKHANLMLLIILLLYRIIPHYLINDTIFRKTLLNMQYVFWFSLQLWSEIFLILSITQRDTYINAHRSSRKVPVIRVRFEWNLNFLDILSKNAQMSNFMKIRPLGTELFHTGKRTNGLV
jgi:hypothetical protein